MLNVRPDLFSLPLSFGFLSVETSVIACTPLHELRAQKIRFKQDKGPNRLLRGAVSHIFFSRIDRQEVQVLFWACEVWSAFHPLKCFIIICLLSLFLSR